MTADMTYFVGLVLTALGLMTPIIVLLLGAVRELRRVADALEDRPIAVEVIEPEPGPPIC